MEVGACQAADPVSGIACSTVAKLFRAGRHACPERFREGLKRCFVDAQRAQSVTRERQVEA
ncbi:hypothetical protein Slala05_80340 [Streptomyces lavendulae subsp. lavendulae]|nr:hypothetical protein Slala05_80340 [Streptomyces lavendulae subsp. lavendulae]